IPRVLSIKRSDQLAPVKLIRRQYGKIEFNAKPIARAGTQRTQLWSQHATTKDGVDLNFDLTGFAFDDQLGIAKISGRNQSRMQPELKNAFTDGRQLLVDVSQSLISAFLPRKINNININR